MKDQVYLGILGDPAKIELYSSEFYEFLKWDESQSCYYLLGASERDVQKKQFQEMYDRIASLSSSLNNFQSINGLTDGLSRRFSSRIGLFPSSASHLIKGPEFTFSPYPINTKNRWLKIKSRLLTHLIQPFVSLRIIPLAYHPMGGKAAERTESDTTIDVQLIIERFKRAFSSRYLRWFYLEGGSGSNFMGEKMISEIITAVSMNKRIVDRMIYGGGITHHSMINQLFSMEFIPKSIVVGNISETKISETYRILECVKELNESLL